MKKAFLLIILSSSCFGMTIDQQLSQIINVGNKLNASFEYLSQKSLHVFWPYFIAVPVTCNSMIRFFNTPPQKENQTELIKHGTISLIGLGALSAYSWLHLQKTL